MGVANARSFMLYALVVGQWNITEAVTQMGNNLGLNVVRRGASMSQKKVIAMPPILRGHVSRIDEERVTRASEGGFPLVLRS